MRDSDSGSLREADPSFAERFHREARALARFNHPNIVTVFDCGEQGGWYYLLKELVDGAHLRQATRTRWFTPEQPLEIVPQICGAPQYAHGEGVLHRDVKPENLLLDSKGRVKVVDFIIAKLGRAGEGEPTLTLSGARLGTVAPPKLRPVCLLVRPSLAQFRPSLMVRLPPFHYDNHPASK